MTHPTETRRQKTNADEIDLVVLAERGLRFIQRFRILFIMAIVLGLALGIFAYLLLPRIYQSRMIVHSFTLTNQEQINILKNWNDLLKKAEYNTLSKTLNCRADLLRKVKKLRADEIQQVFTSDNPHGFTIEVNVTDNSILPDLQNGIVYGFENSEYIKKRLAIKRQNLQDLISKTETEVKKLDSMKQVIGKIIEGKASASSSLIIDGSSINRQWIEMNEKLLSYKESLQFTSAVQVLQSFSQFDRPEGPNLIPWLVIGQLFLLPIAFLTAVLISLKEKLQRRRRYEQAVAAS